MTLKSNWKNTSWQIGDASLSLNFALRPGTSLPASSKSLHSTRFPIGGFTLIELLTALLILSLLALMSYRGLATVLDAREHVIGETGKWRHMSAFFARFEHDIDLVAPSPVRSVSGNAPAWHGSVDAKSGPRLEFSRFASAEGVDTPRRILYRLNGKQQIELWLWSGLDVASDAQPERYPVLEGVKMLEFEYLNNELIWSNTWPTSLLDAAIPRAMRMRIVLVSGEQIVRVFALNS